MRTIQVLLILGLSTSPALGFDFSRELFGSPPTLALGPPTVNPDTGYVWLNGVDTGGVIAPFTVDWGDGTVPQQLWFPFEHTYLDRTHDFVVTVTAHYPGGVVDHARTVIWFVPATIGPVSFPISLAVTIPDQDVVLGTRLYPPPAGLTHFDASFFALVPRPVIEHLLTAAAVIQLDSARGDVFRIDDAFNQVVLRAPGFGGMYSLWFTSPVAFASGDSGFVGSIGYSSFFHEMGHNVTLNSPASFYYGGRIDGSANAIFSETMAQIFAHATAHQMLNYPGAYGITPYLAVDIESSARSSMMLVRTSYEAYQAAGHPYTSWNVPETQADETFGSFMTLAYTFASHAEQTGGSYLRPLRRMMCLLELFDAELETAYDREHDTPAADTFRSTLMVAALSHAFATDLRGELGALGFPVDDGWYASLTAEADTTCPLFADGFESATTAGWSHTAP